MSLVPRNSLFDFDHFFDHFWSPTVDTKGNLAPRVDIKERNDHYEITAELPGLSKDNIHITLDGGVLTLDAESHQEDSEEKDGKVIRQERRYGRYSRSFNLGAGVQESDIQANFDNGILTVTAPKVEAQTPESRRISIN